jgi:hypothetical protein
VMVNGRNVTSRRQIFAFGRNSRRTDACLSHISFYLFLKKKKKNVNVN